MDLKDSRTLRALFKYIDEHEKEFIEVLQEGTSIPSVSLDPFQRESCHDMVRWVVCKLKALGAVHEEVEIGKQEFPDGRTLRMPPLVLGDLESNDNLATICIYGHLDVYPAAIREGMLTDPFKMNESEGYLYGRGTSTKGSVLCWLNAVKAYQGCGITLPVNMKFVLESMKECQSQGLANILQERKGSFFKNIYSTCLMANYWLCENSPCLTYGVRGLCSFTIEIQCSSINVDGGVYGGLINEAMTDTVFLLNTLVGRNGEILIPNFNQDVLPITDKELSWYKSINFKVNDFKKSFGAKELLHDEEKVSLLLHNWRFPSLSIHRIDSSVASEQLIPYKVTANFSIRIVPDQTPEQVEELVVNHLMSEWKKRGSLNKLKVVIKDKIKPWAADPMSKNFEAAKKSIYRVYNQKAELTREGGVFPIASKFQEVTESNVMFFPLWIDEGSHSSNERISVKHYMQGIKLCGAYMYEVAQNRISDWNKLTEFGTQPGS